MAPLLSDVSLSKAKVTMINENTVKSYRLSALFRKKFKSVTEQARLVGFLIKSWVAWQLL